MVVKRVDRHEGHHSEVPWESWKGRQGNVFFLLDVLIGIALSISIAIIWFVLFVPAFVFMVVATKTTVLFIMLQRPTNPPINRCEIFFRNGTTVDSDALSYVDQVGGGEHPGVAIVVSPKDAFAEGEGGAFAFGSGDV